MIYFFYGDEEFNISNEIKKLKSNLDKDFIEMSFKQFNNPKFPDLIAAVRTQPMMFGKMLIVINCLTYLSGKSSDENGFDDKQIKQLTEALDNVSENLNVIFVAQLPPDSQKKIDKRKKIFKLLSKYNSKEFVQIPSYKTAELESWIKQQAKSKDLKDAKLLHYLSSATFYLTKEQKVKSLEDVLAYWNISELYQYYYLVKEKYRL